MDDHISKPIDPDVMFATMGRFYRRAGTAQGAPPSPPPRPVEAPFPQIEGVDVTAGLKRVAGNSRLYRSLLQRFVDAQEGAARDIGKALEDGDMKGAEMRAHSLNGIAGTLGVEAVHAAAAELERLLRDGDTSRKLEAARVVLDTALRAATDAIKAMPRNAEATADRKAREPAPESTSAAIQELSRLIEESDSEALPVFESLRVTWENLAGPEETKAVADLLSEYDFAAALPRVRRFRLRMEEFREKGGADGGRP